MTFEKVVHFKKPSVLKIFFASVVIGLALISPLSASGQEELFDRKPVQVRDTELPGREISTLEDMQYSFRKVAQKVLPTVVEINVVDVIKQPVPRFQFPFDFFFGPRGGNNQTPQEREYRRYGLGSGVIVRKAGNKAYVLTNNHVVGKAEEISVKLQDQRQFTAKLIGNDEKKDLALVVFETDDDVPVAELGDSDSLYVGDWVLAVGNPLGFESTVTVGIVSAIGRQSVPGTAAAGFTDYIQTDASINRGNSGGALVNIRGQVVGINTWIASPSGGNIGIGFAIPINNAKKALEDFITKGKVEYGWLGINVGNVPEETAADLGIKGMPGGFVYGVFRGSPADKAGILPGDYITRINNEQIKDSTHILIMVSDLAPGKVADFEIVRYGRRMDLSVKIAVRQEEAEIAGQANKIWPGISAVRITDDIRRQLNLSSGLGEVIIGMVEKGSPADVAGLRSGDIIKEINGVAIESVMDFYMALKDQNTGQLMFKIGRQGTQIIVGLIR